MTATEPARRGRGSLSDRIAGLVVLVGSALYLLQARTLKPVLQTEPLGPATFPLAVGAMMFLLGGLLFVASFRPRAPTVELGEVPRPGQGIAVYGRPASLWVLLTAYVLAFVPLGFPAATAVFLVLAFRLLGVRWIAAALIAGLFTWLAWLGFQALDVQLPPGRLFR